MTSCANTLYTDVQGYVEKGRLDHDLIRVRKAVISVLAWVLLIRRSLD